MTENTIMVIVLIIVLLDFLIGQLLNYFNLRHHSVPLPPAFHDLYDSGKLKTSQAYFRSNIKYGFVKSAFNFFLLFIMLYYDLFGMLSNLIVQEISDKIVASLIFLAVLFLGRDIFNIPFELYKIFVIEKKFGFNKTTITIFLADKIKGYFLGTLIGGILMYILLFLINTWGSFFWFWFWIVTILFTALVNVFYTSLIIPLFNTLKPLEEGNLKQAIQAYSAKVNFPLDNIFVIDGSKRSSKANAFFSGIGSKKKIVLYDTLISNHTNEEVVAVFAHEVGHYKKKHLTQGLVLSVLQTGCMLFMLSKIIFSIHLSNALGAPFVAIHLNLIAFAILYTPVSAITTLFTNLLSRRNEFEADQFAAMSYESVSLQQALKKLSTNSLNNLTPHPAYVFVHYAHPPLIARLSHLQNYH
jgi:STE24 endopeptidase